MIDFLALRVPGNQPKMTRGLAPCHSEQPRISGLNWTCFWRPEGAPTFHLGQSHPKEPHVLGWIDARCWQNVQMQAQGTSKFFCKQWRHRIPDLTSPMAVRLVKPEPIGI